MSLILNIETSTKNCSISISRNFDIIQSKSLLSEKHSHSEILTLFIQDIFKKSDLNLKDLDAIAVSKGPGSYTGLRIGISTAKGLCYSLDIPLISVSTLQSMSLGISNNNPHYDLYCPMIDARRMEVFSAFYDSENQQIREVRADIIDENSYVSFLNKKILFFGDGSEKCKEVLTRENSHFLDNIFPNANDMVEISYQKYLQDDFEDVAYFEPYYLKDFVVGEKKN